MTVFRIVMLSGLSACLAACAGRGEDYQRAEELPALVLPAGQDARPIKPLFPVPPAAVKPEWPAKFVVPRPRPMAEVVVETPVTGADSPQTSERPTLTQDGNGYAVLSIRGDFNAIWDGLDQALRAASVKIEDRDQSLSQYYLSLADVDGKRATYQLRVTRGQSAYNLTLQKDDDTLAAQDMTRTLFESIVARWPGDKP